MAYRRSFVHFITVTVIQTVVIVYIR